MQAFQEFASDRLGTAGSAGGGGDVFCQDLDLFCEQHVHLASDAALRRKIQTQRRLKWILDLWEDAERFEGVVMSGRYRRLCQLMRLVSDSDARAWQRLKREILAVRAQEFLTAA